jgi:hypothetical protein
MRSEFRVDEEALLAAHGMGPHERVLDRVNSLIFCPSHSA